MNKKKIILIVAMCMILLLSACGSKKTPQTMAGVKDYLAGRGLYNEDKAYSNSRITGDTLAMILTNGWSVSFGEYKTVADCVSEYSMGQLILDDPVETTESNYSIIEGKQGDDYKIIVRVDDTLLVIAGPGDAKEDLRELAKDLGYY